MRATHENSETQNSVQSPPAPHPRGSEVRLAAVVQAAYILQARTR